YELLLSDYALARVQFDAAADLHERMIETIIPMVDQQYADTRRIADLGEINTLLILDTLRRQYEAKLQLIDSVAQYALASLRLRELLGPDLNIVQRDTP